MFVQLCIPRIHLGWYLIFHFHWIELRTWRRFNNSRPICIRPSRRITFKQERICTNRILQLPMFIVSFKKKPPRSHLVAPEACCTCDSSSIKTKTAKNRKIISGGILWRAATGSDGRSPSRPVRSWHKDDIQDRPCVGIVGSKSLVPLLKNFQWFVDHVRISIYKWSYLNNGHINVGPFRKKFMPF